MILAHNIHVTQGWGGGGNTDNAFISLILSILLDIYLSSPWQRLQNGQKFLCHLKWHKVS